MSSSWNNTKCSAPGRVKHMALARDLCPPTWVFFNILLVTFHEDDIFFSFRISVPILSGYISWVLCLQQYCGSRPFLYGSGSGSCFSFDTDPDPTVWYWSESLSLPFQRGNVTKTVLFIHLKLIFLVSRSTRTQPGGSLLNFPFQLILLCSLD